jgi:hypothetical protein
MPLLVVLIALWGAIVVLVIAVCVTASRGSSGQPPPYVDAPAAPPTVVSAAEDLPLEAIPALTGHDTGQVRQLEPL